MLLPRKGQLEPMLIRLRMSRKADRQRVERIDDPIRANRLAEHVGEEEVGDPLGHVSLHEQVIDQRDLE